MQSYGGERSTLIFRPTEFELILEIFSRKLLDLSFSQRMWTRTEFQRQKATDLNTAMRAAECVSDYQPKSSEDRPSENSQSGEGGRRPFRPSSNSNGGERYSQNRGGPYQDNRRITRRATIKTAVKETITTVPVKTGIMETQRRADMMSLLD